MKEKLKTFSDNLKKTREKKRYTQQEIAKKAGMTVQAYNRYEKGKTEPGILTAKKIANACGTTLENLLRKEQEKK